MPIRMPKAAQNSAGVIEPSYQSHCASRLCRAVRCWEFIDLPSPSVATRARCRPSWKGSAGTQVLAHVFRVTIGLPRPPRCRNVASREPPVRPGHQLSIHCAPTRSALGHPMGDISSQLTDAAFSAARLEHGTARRSLRWLDCTLSHHSSR